MTSHPRRESETADGPPVHVATMRLSYADCDPAGIIYYAAWFIAMERSLTDWFYGQDLRFDRMKEELGGAPVTRATWCDYLAPATVYEEVRIEMRVGSVGTSSYRLDFSMVRESDEVRLASSAMLGVFVGLDGRPAPLPERFRVALTR